MIADLASLETLLGYHFQHPDLLRRALVHRSYVADHPAERSNERLEFLGDAVLQLAVTDFIFSEFPSLSEGDMAKVRAAVVNAASLAALAEELGLGARLFLGRGEEATGGRVKDSIVADAMEAVLGAVYLDAGLEKAREVILALLGKEIADRATHPGGLDYKTRLQEVLARQRKRPVYRLRGEGPDHLRTFSASVEVDGVELGRGTGRSKKSAEQRAAQQALATMSFSRGSPEPGAKR